MKIVKTTHCRGQEKTTDFVWFESEDIELIKKKLARLGQFFTEGLSENSYWVRISIQ